MERLMRWLHEPKRLRHLHAFAVVVWFLLIIPTLLFWAESVLWIALMSIWANIAGHWSAWQAVRAEENGDG